MNTLRKKIPGLVSASMASLMLAPSCTPGSQSETSSSQTPNIIYILADDLGYGDLGCYGQQKIETPNIDALAKRGMRFTQHYSGAPVCAPSRCVLLTGLHSGHAQIRGNDEWADRGPTWDFEAMAKDPRLEGQRPLKAGTQTLGTVLQQVGYKTAVIGKWGLGAPFTEGVANKQGFDFFYGYNCQRQAHTYFPLHLWRDTIKEPLDNRLVAPHKKLAKDVDKYNPASYEDFWLTDYSADLMQKEAIRFVKENKEEPFFLYYASPIPHVPLQAPKRWVDYYVKKFGDEEPYTGNQGYFPHRNPKAAYAAMVSYLDEQVGELVATLKEEGIYENTVIVFTSDNGPTFNGGTDSPWFDSGGPFKSERGWGKAFTTEGGLRVPMIIQWPGKIEAGSETDHISAFYDVLPTFSELTGAELKDPVDGISFLPEVMGKTDQAKHDFLYWEFPASGGQQAVRMGKWKGIRRNIFKDSMQVHLYNLEEDIQELNDVADQHPEIVQQIERIFEQEHEPAELEKFKIKQLGD